MVTVSNPIKVQVSKEEEGKDTSILNRCTAKIHQRTISLKRENALMPSESTAIASIMIP